MATMRAVLLDRSNGFIARVPARTLVENVNDSGQEGIFEPSADLSPKQDDTKISVGHLTPDGVTSASPATYAQRK